MTSGLLRTELKSMAETLANLKRERRGVEDAFNRYQLDSEAAQLAEEQEEAEQHDQ